MTQAKAGEVLGISERQVRRLVKRVKEQGAKGLVHRNRGRPSPKKMTEEREEQIGLIIEESYRDFGPTLASEKLSERHGIEIGREKLRQIMIARGLWQVRRYKKKTHQWRERKHHYGEMIQMDGSHHDWLEGRGPEMVFMGLEMVNRNPCTMVNRNPFFRYTPVRFKKHYRSGNDKKKNVQTDSNI